MRFPILLATFCITTTVCAAPEGAPPTLAPSAGAVDICPDTPLRLTFSAPPALAKGTLKIVADGNVVDTLDLGAEKLPKALGSIANPFNTPPALLDGNTLYLFPTKPLAYGHTYTIRFDDGAVKDASGAPVAVPPNWTFTTKKAAPAAGTTNLTISPDSHADFATLQGALDFIPDNNTTPTTLLLKKGTYHEIVAFTNKHNLTIQGEDRKATILAFSNNANLNPQGNPYHRGLFIANRCNDLTIANMTFHNTTPRGGSQAESLILDRVSRAILTDLDLVSFQDTLQINGQAYIQNSYIEGDVDFIWGTGPCFFQNVTCKTTRPRAYFTQIRNTLANHGYIFNKCTFAGAEGATNNVLSRIDPARFPASEVVLLDCTMTDAVGPLAWRLDNVPDQAAAAAAQFPTLHFWEFNSRTPDGKPVDTSQRLPISRQLKEPDDKETIANYRNPAWVLGNDWTPKVPAPYNK